MLCYVMLSLGYRSGVTNPQYIQTTWTGMNLAATSSAIPDQETSPLIFAVVADLFNMSIINHQDFVGHVIDAKVSAKISAFADDTAVHVGCLEDIVIYKMTLGERLRNQPPSSEE